MGDAPGMLPLAVVLAEFSWCRGGDATWGDVWW